MIAALGRRRRDRAEHAPGIVGGVRAWELDRTRPDGSAERAASAQAVAAARQLRIVERGCAGARTLRKQVSRTSHAAFAPSPDRRDPIEVLEEQAATPRARSCCRSATAGWRPRRSRSSAAPPRSWRWTSPTTPRLRASQAQLCGDAHLRELRHLQLARAPARVRPQRLRRDAARAVGVGRQAPRGLAGDRRPGQRLRRGRRPIEVVRDAVRAVPPRDGRLRRAAQPRRSGTPASRSTTAASPTCATAMDKQRSKQCRSATSPSSPRATTCRRSRKLTTEVVDGVPRFRSAPPLVVPLRRARRAGVRRRGDEWVGARPRARPRRLPRDRSTTTVATSSSSTSSPTSRARWSASAASAPARGSSLLLGRDDDDPLILQFKEADASVLEPYVGRSASTSQGGHRVVAGPAAHAGDERHLPGLVPRPGPRRRSTATSTSASCATARAASTSRRCDPGRRCAPTPGSAPGPSRAPTPAPATASRSRRTSAAAARSTTRWSTFAHLYAEQNERDHAALVAAIADGRITALSGRLSAFVRIAGAAPGDRSYARAHAPPRRTAMAGKFVLKTDAAGKFRFNLVAGNGEIIAQSQAYKSQGVRARRHRVGAQERRRCRGRRPEPESAAVSSTRAPSSSLALLASAAASASRA